MSKVTYLNEEEERLAFVREAAAWFNEHPDHWTFAYSNPEAEQWLALRWGPTGQAVMLVKLDHRDPVIFADCIERRPYPRVAP